MASNQCEDAPQGRWLEIVPSDPDASALPAWQKRLWVSAEGDIYVPAAHAPPGPEVAFLSACWDGIDVVHDGDGHVYLPLDWMEREYRERFAHLATMIRQLVAQAVS